MFSHNYGYILIKRNVDLLGEYVSHFFNICLDLNVGRLKGLKNFLSLKISFILHIMSGNYAKIPLNCNFLLNHEIWCNNRVPV